MKRLSGEENRSKRKGWEQVGYLYKMHQHTQCQIQYLGDLRVWVSGIWVSSGTVSMCGCQHLGHLRGIIRDSSGAFFLSGSVSVAFLSGSAQGHSSYLGHLRGILIRVNAGAFLLGSALGHSSSLDHLRGIRLIILLIRVSSGAFVLSGSSQGHPYQGQLRGVLLIRVSSGAFVFFGSSRGHPYQGHSSYLGHLRGILTRVNSGGILLTWVISGAFVSGSSQGHSYLVHLRGILIWFISGAFLSGSSQGHSYLDQLTTSLDQYVSGYALGLRQLTTSLDQYLGQHRPATIRMWVSLGQPLSECGSAQGQPLAVCGSARGPAFVCSLVSSRGGGCRNNKSISWGELKRCGLLTQELWSHGGTEAAKGWQVAVSDGVIIGHRGAVDHVPQPKTSRCQQTLARHLDASTR